MSNKSKTVKAIVPTVKANPNASALKEINFDKFAKQLENVNIKEKKSKDSLYIYPESVVIAGINSDSGKSFRGKLRNRLENLCNNILSAYKSKDAEKLNIAIEKFKSNYKENYSKNDYSFESFSRTDKNKFIIEKSIEIVKETL